MFKFLKKLMDELVDEVLDDIWYSSSWCDTGITRKEFEEYMEKHYGTRRKYGRY